MVVSTGVCSQRVCRCNLAVKSRRMGCIEIDIASNFGGRLGLRAVVDFRHSPDIADLLFYSMHRAISAAELVALNTAPNLEKAER